MTFDAFLSTITMGEYVAATDCSIAKDYFRKKGNSNAVRAYEAIRQDELRHFKMLKKVVGRLGGVSPAAKALFRGEFMENHIGDLEPIVLMHSVFEPAAFAYLSEIKKQDKELGPHHDELRKACTQILIDEALHMEVGLDFVRPEVSQLSPEEQERLSASIVRHQDVLAKVPSDTLVDPALARKIRKSFRKNCEHCVKKLMRKP